MEDIVIFVCEHGSAKSVVAAAHFNRIAREKGLAVAGVSRGTNPDAEIPESIIHGLRSDGIISSPDKPVKLDVAEVSKAIRVISFCDLPFHVDSSKSERWDVPPVSEDYSKARDVILQKITRLVEELKNSK